MEHGNDVVVVVYFTERILATRVTSLEDQWEKVKPRGLVDCLLVSLEGKGEKQRIMGKLRKRIMGVSTVREGKEREPGKKELAVSLACWWTLMRKEKESVEFFSRIYLER